MSVLLARNAASGCTKETCPASHSIYGYAPTFDSSVGFIATFAISFLAYYHQSFVWPKWRFYSLIMAFGCLMESLGYIGRLMLHNDPFSEMGFKINVILLTIAPAFLSAGLYIMLKRLVTFFGPEFSRITPNAYAYIFVTADIVSIILQGAGGTISAIATDKTFLDQGVDIMIAGLVSQVVTLMIFAGLCVDFYLNARKNSRLQPICRRQFAGSLKFKLVVGAMTFSFLCILTRCAYRMAELSEGWGSEIMRKEVDFIIMDSVMCLLAALSLNIFHPGHFFEDPETAALEASLAAEKSLKRQTRRQTLSREKTRGYSMMPDERFFDLQPPQPTWVGNVTCVQCALRDDRRSWI